MELINFEVENERFKIFANIINQGNDLIVIIKGGEIHVGAVGVSIPADSSHFKNKIISTSTITLPGHKDDVVCKLIGEKIAKELNKIVCVICGIHYDNLKKNEINEILDLCEKLGEKIIEKFRGGNE